MRGFEGLIRNLGSVLTTLVAVIAGSFLASSLPMLASDRGFSGGEVAVLTTAGTLGGVLGIVYQYFRLEPAPWERAERRRGLRLSTFAGRLAIQLGLSLVAYVAFFTVVANDSWALAWSAALLAVSFMFFFAAMTGAMILLRLHDEQESASQGPEAEDEERKRKRDVAGRQLATRIEADNASLPVEDLGSLAAERWAKQIDAELPGYEAETARIDAESRAKHGDAATGPRPGIRQQSPLVQVRVVYRGGPNDSQADVFEQAPDAIGAGEQIHGAVEAAGGTYAPTDERDEDGRVIYQWRPITDEAADEALQRPGQP